MSIEKSDVVALFEKVLAAAPEKLTLLKSVVAELNVPLTVCVPDDPLKKSVVGLVKVVPLWVRFPETLIWVGAVTAPEPL